MFSQIINILFKHCYQWIICFFSLDEQLFKDCKDDAKRVCNTADFDSEAISLPHGVIIACLFRNSLHDTPAEHKVLSIV